MKKFRIPMVSACVAGALCLAIAAMAEDPMGGAAVASAVQVTATVEKINQESREVTLKGADGQEVSFVAGDDVKNLAQVKEGDVVTVTYAEALAYEIKKGGTTGVGTVAAGEAAELGEKPAGAMAHQTTVTVAITAIDPKVPSVTFTGPAGNSRTIKVRHPEKLEGVNVGDTVEITYTEAIAINVETAP